MDKAIVSIIENTPPWFLYAMVIFLVVNIVVAIIKWSKEEFEYDKRFHDAFEQIKANDCDEHSHVIKQYFKCPYCGAESSFDLDLRVCNMYHIVGTVKCEYCDKHYYLNDVLTNKKFEVFKTEV